MGSELSEPLENYLKEIYELEEIKGHARVSDLIEIFRISPGTISKAISKLEKLGLIKRGNRKIELTEEGRRLAEKLIRSHRLSERLLTDILGLDWIRAHELAHKLEHIWPEDVLDKIDEILNRPTTCPHGHPIPGRGKVKGIVLSEAQINKDYEVVMIIREEEWVLALAGQYGLVPGIRVKLINKNQDKYEIEVNGSLKEIPKALADEVLVNGIN
ncbi:MAG: metal-dependent transcriptional regulator [Sulfolobaceae archaeon]|jgi:DtxR family Mn-dependent transcriptional regulator|nr:metal-dependent transcriptional regulator [Sulfolobaceae archaeon]